jgi:hypothetical protein
MCLATLAGQVMGPAGSQPSGPLDWTVSPDQRTARSLVVVLAGFFIIPSDFQLAAGKRRIRG